MQRYCAGGGEDTSDVKDIEINEERNNVDKEAQIKEEWNEVDKEALIQRYENPK